MQLPLLTLEIPYCDFERRCGNEFRYILRHMTICNFHYCHSVLAFMSSLVHSSGPICVIAFGIEKVLWVQFSRYISLLKTLWHVLNENLRNTKVRIRLLLYLILYWYFLVNLLIPREYKFAFLVTLS